MRRKQLVIIKPGKAAIVANVEFIYKSSNGTITLEFVDKATTYAMIQILSRENISFIADTATNSVEIYEQTLTVKIQ